MKCNILYREVRIKRKKTNEILAESFRELAKTKSVDKITIQDIADNCEYSTATFYRHFRDKYDLIIWDYMGKISDIINSMEEKSWKNTVSQSIEYFNTDRSYLRNLLKHTAGQDSFVRHMALANTTILSREVIKMTGRAELDKEVSLYIQLYCHGAAQILCDWIQGNIQVSMEELTNMPEKSLPLPVSNYISPLTYRTFISLRVYMQVLF